MNTKKDTTLNNRLFSRKGRPLLERHSGKEKIVFVVVFIIFLIHTISLLIPVLYILLTSLKGKYEYFENPIGFPQAWQFSNFAEAFETLNVNDVTFGMMFFNSVWFTVLNVLSYLFAPALLGYIMAKYTFKGRNFLYSLIIFSLTIPIVGSGAAAMKLIVNLGLYDNPLHIIVNFLNGFTGHFLIFYGFFKSVSWSYAESAQIDGAGHFKTYLHIMLPQALPIFLTFAITDSIDVWNTYESVLLYYPSYPTLSAGLFTFKENALRGNFPVYYAGLLMAIIPTLLLFSIFSKKIMTSISVGGLKG